MLESQTLRLQRLRQVKVLSESDLPVEAEVAEAVVVVVVPLVVETRQVTRLHQLTLKSFLYKTRPTRPTNKPLQLLARLPNSHDSQNSEVHLRMASLQLPRSWSPTCHMT